MVHTTTVPQPIQEAGLALEWQNDGTSLVVRDADPEGCAIRNRGGEALANLLRENRQVKILDLSTAGIRDNGLGHLCLLLRQTDQLEELALGPLGHAGLDFLLGVVRRCGRLQKLSAVVEDVPTRSAAGQNVVAADYDVSSYEKKKPADGEEPEGEQEEEEEVVAEPEGDGDDDEDEGAKARKKLEKLRQIFAENDYDSGDEGSSSPPAGSARAAVAMGKRSKEATLTLSIKLGDLAAAVRKQEGLTFVDIKGDAVPPDVKTDLARAVAEHRQQQQRRADVKEERSARTAHDVLKDQMQELRAIVEGTGADQSIGAEGLLPGESAQSSDPSTHLGLRSYIGRRLFAALGESLFECQRYKSKENEAVSTWQGECAFIAMYLRKLAQEQEEKAGET